MKTIEVFDPAMCCSSGACGPSVDPTLARFAADLQWLATQGVTVARHGLATDPAAFATNALVRNTLQTEGTDCLPIVLCDGEILSKGRYPARNTLARSVGMEIPLPLASLTVVPCCTPSETGESSCCNPSGATS